MRISFLVEGMPKAFGTTTAVIVGLGNGVVRALHGVSYCHNSRLEPDSIFNKVHPQSAKAIENTKYFKRFPPFPPYRYPVRLTYKSPAEINQRDSGYQYHRSSIWYAERLSGTLNNYGSTWSIPCHLRKGYPLFSSGFMPHTTLKSQSTKVDKVFISEVVLPKLASLLAEAI